MPLFRRRPSAPATPTETPPQHPFEKLSEREIREAEAGSDILSALAQLLEEAEAPPRDVARIRQSAQAIYVLTELHPHGATSDARRFARSAQGEHERKIRERLTAWRYPIERPSDRSHLGTWTIANHSSWRQDRAGRIYDTENMLLAENLSDLTPVMRELGWLHGNTPYWEGTVRGPNEDVDRAQAVRQKMSQPRR